MATPKTYSVQKKDTDFVNNKLSIATATASLTGTTGIIGEQVDVVTGAKDNLMVVYDGTSNFIVTRTFPRSNDVMITLIG